MNLALSRSAIGVLEQWSTGVTGFVDGMNWLPPKIYDVNRL